MEKFDFKACVEQQMRARGLRCDANESAAFSRELEYVFAEIVEAKYPDLTWRNVVPIKAGAPLGATSTRWFELDSFGEAVFLDNMGTEDFPTQDLKGQEQTGRIRSMGAKYAITVEELRAAQLMRVKVETEKPKMTRKSIETLFDKTVWGSTTTNYGGFAGLIADATCTAWTGTPDNWFDAVIPGSGDPNKIVANVRGMLDEAYLLTKSLFPQFDLFVPPEIEVLLAYPMSLTLNGVTTQLNISIAQYMLSNIPRLRSISGGHWRLSAAGASGKHRVLAYPNDPEVFDVFVPLDFEQFAPQLSGMSFVTHCHAKFGGLRAKHPVAMRRMDLAVAHS